MYMPILALDLVTKTRRVTLNIAALGNKGKELLRWILTKLLCDSLDIDFLSLGL